MFSKNRAISQYWGFLQKNCIFRLIMTNRGGDGKQTVKLLTLVESHYDEMKMPRTHLHKLSTELFALRIPEIS